MEKAPKARIGDLDKKKYLVPSDLTGNHRENQQSPRHLEALHGVMSYNNCCNAVCYSDSGPVLLPHPEKNPLES